MSVIDTTTSARTNPVELLDLAKRIVGWATAGEQIEAFASRSTSTNVKIQGGSIESLTRAQNEGVGIRVVASGRQGLAWCTVLDEDALLETLAEARDNASFGSIDESFGLAIPDGVALPTGLDRYRPGLLAVTTDEKIAMAMQLERLALGGDPRVRGARIASYSDSIGGAAIATSTGIAVFDESTSAALTVTLMASDGHGDDVQTGYGFDLARDSADLDIEKTAAEAVRRAVSKIGSTKPESATLTMVLDPQATPSFVSMLGTLANGDSVLKGRSLWADRIGEQVASAAVTLVSDPSDPTTLAADATDAEGLASRRNVIVSEGSLDGFLYNAQVARKAGTVSTGSAARGGYGSSPGIGARALSLAPGTKSQAEIIKGIEHGVLVDSLIGLHSGVNLVSGDVSIGAAGWMIRDGEIAEPVKEFTVASTIQRMLLDVADVGNDIEWRMGTAGCTVAIDNVRLGGK